MSLAPDTKKNTGRSLSRALMLLSALLTASAGYSAHADGTFLLQLGSFNNQAQATQKWDDVKSKNSDVVGSLNLHVAEVTVPPDNTVSYRTQAGPVATRDQASSLCDTLQSRSIDCYVVETALFTPDQPATTADAPAVTPPTTPVAEAQPTAPVVTAAPPAETASTINIPPADSAAQPAAPAPTPVPPVPVAAQEASVPPLPAQSPVLSAPPAVQAPAPQATTPPLPPSGVIAERAPRFLNAPAAPAPAFASTTVTVPAAPVASDAAPIAADAPAAETSAEQPGFFGRLFGESPPPPRHVQPDAVGNVDVAEAIRVPLGSGVSAARTGITAVPGLPSVHGLGGSPSQNGGHTLWAQLSYFSDEEAARNFYDRFRATYPQFSDGVRVRITRPYASSAGRVSLRVGPFAGVQDVTTICRAASQSGVRCSVVRDVGGSSATNTSRHRASYHIGSIEHSSYGSEAETGGKLRPSTYWAQLGSFHSEDDAWDHWKELRQDDRKLLRHIQASVQSPAMSSAARPIFRLRAGPFATQTAASSLCGALRAHGASCMVLGER